MSRNPPLGVALGLPNPSIADLVRVLGWNAREVFRPGRHYWRAIPFAIAALVSGWLWVPVVGQVIGAAASLPGIPRTLLLTGIVAAVGLSLLCVFETIRWVVVWLHPVWTVYVAADHEAVVVVRSVQRRGWVLSRHLAAHRQRGSGARLRDQVLPALAIEAQSVPVTLSATIRQDRVRSSIRRQYPGLQERGRHLTVNGEVQGPADALGRTSLPTTLAAAVRSRSGDSSNSSGVLALTGAWGSGKSWVLEQVVPLLEFPDGNARRIRTVRFNPWLFAGEDALFAGFAELLLQQLRRKRARRRLSKILEVVGPSSKFGPVDLSGTARVAATHLGAEQTAERITHALATALEQRGPLCVLIDDVDRLTSDELLTLFKLVRLLGNVPNLHYVLSYDEDTVLALLEETTVAAHNPVRARAYLEKMVEQRLTVPPMTGEQIRARIIAPILEYPSDVGITIRTGVADRTDLVLTYVLARHITTVRLADRFVAAVKTLPPGLRDEIDYADWVFTQWVRTVAPPAWTWIVEHRDELLGLGRYERGREASWPVVTEQLRSLGYGGALLEDLNDAVHILFPSVPQPGTAALGATSVEDSRTRRGIGSTLANFERYIWVDLPPGQQPDARILKQLRGLRLTAANDPLRATNNLEALYQENSSAVFAMIEASQGDPEIQWPAILEFLRVRLWESHQAMVEDRHRTRTRATANRAFYDMSAEDRDLLFQRAKTRPDQWYDILRGIRQDEMPPEELDSVTPKMRSLRTAAFDLIHGELEAVPAPTLPNLAGIERFWDLLHVDAQEARRFLRQQVERHSWPLDDAAALLVNLYGKPPHLEHRGVPIADVRSTFGDEMLRAYAGTLPPPSDLSRDFFHSESPHIVEPATRQSVRTAVHGAIQQWARSLEP